MVRRYEGEDQGPKPTGIMAMRDAFLCPARNLSATSIAARQAVIAGLTNQHLLTICMLQRPLHPRKLHHV